MLWYRPSLFHRLSGIFMRVAGTRRYSLYRCSLRRCSMRRCLHEVGELPMKAQCLPFQQIPHTTRLFLDYLSYTPSVQPFYPRSPIFSEWVKDESQRVKYDDSRRGKVSGILERQNRQAGAPPLKTLDNIERLKRGAFAAVTGQQVGLFGGPSVFDFQGIDGGEAGRASDCGWSRVRADILARDRRSRSG